VLAPNAQFHSLQPPRMDPVHLRICSRWSWLLLLWLPLLRYRQAQMLLLLLVLKMRLATLLTAR
jgi:hypothetical protein